MKCQLNSDESLYARLLIVSSLTLKQRDLFISVSESHPIKNYASDTRGSSTDFFPGENS